MLLFFLVCCIIFGIGIARVQVDVNKIIKIISQLIAFLG